MSLPPLAAEIASGFSGFAGAIERLDAEWASEEAPVTVSMGELGRTLVEEAGGSFSIDEVEAVLSRVERVLESGTEGDKDAAATGFLEALAAAVDRLPTTAWILALAGPLSRAYLAAWDEFCGRP